MGYRNLKITIVSSDDLPNVRRMGRRMRVYAVISCNSVTFTTKVDTENNRNPRWRESFHFLIDEESSIKKQGGTHVVVRLYCRRGWGKRDRQVGDDVAIEMKSLYDRGPSSENNVTYRVPNGKGGTLHILYDFGRELVYKEKYSTLSKIMGCGIATCCAAIPNVI